MQKTLPTAGCVKLKDTVNGNGTPRSTDSSVTVSLTGAILLYLPVMASGGDRANTCCGLRSAETIHILIVPNLASSGTIIA
jgi:hypothetical protein